MVWFAMGFSVACLWGWGCYCAGKRAAENKFLKKREGEYEQVEQVFAHTATLQRDELLEQLRDSSSK